MIIEKMISLIIPCYNESEAIPIVSRRLEMARNLLQERGWALEVLVVNDGSTDSTEKVLSQYPELRVISHPQNLGYGQALKTGFAQSRGELIAMMDMDATYDPTNVVDLLRHLQAHDLDVVFGNRLLDSSDFTRWRRFGNLFLGFVFRHCLRLPRTDVCSGLRLFSRKFIPEILELPYRGFNLSIAMSELFLSQSRKCQQIPIRYSARLGESKLVSFYEGWTHLYVIFTIWLRSRRS
ncbi:MAG: glycosyltransferase family 2 protein [Bdellovibrionales bacterium]